MKLTVNAAAGRLEIGDELTIAGVYEPDRRGRWRRLVDRLLRRPTPAPRLKVFRVVDEGTKAP